MSKRFITAGLMLSTVLMTAVTPAQGASADSIATANSNSEMVPALSSSDSSKASTADNTSDKTSGDKIQALTSQTMVLKKVVVKSGKVKSQVGSIGIADSDVKGINGAVFKIYDVTDLMNTILKEQLKTDTKVTADAKQIDQAVDNATTQGGAEQATISSSSSSSASRTSRSDSSNQSSSVSGDANDSTSSLVGDSSSAISSSNKTAQVNKELEAKVKALSSNDTLRNLVAERAAKMDMGKVKTVATVTTATDKKLKSDGSASVKLPIDGKYHAYYVVNTATPKEAYATNSDPVVVFTPVSQDDGMYAGSFTIYPKSDQISKTPASKGTKPTSRPAVVTKAQMYQTGRTKSSSWLTQFFNHVSSWFK